MKIVMLLSLLAITLPLLSAQENQPAQDPVEQSFAKALDYFAKTQQADGSWHTKGGRPLSVPGSKRMDHYTAIDTRIGLAGMVGLSMLAEGSAPGKGKYAKNIELTLGFVLKGISNPDLGKSNHGAFSVPFAVAFLCELLAVPDRLPEKERADVRAAAEKALKAIVDGQKTDEAMGDCKGSYGYGLAEGSGGRRKEPSSCLSLMGMLIARDAGIAVPEASMKQALTYITYCAIPKRGDFAYQVPSQAPNNYGGFARTAGALYCIKRMGSEQSDIFKAGMAWLDKNHPMKDMQGHEGTFVPFAWFFGAALASQLENEPREKYFASRHKDMIAKQQPDGTWNITGTAVPLNIHTAMSTLALAIAKNTLETFKPPKKKSQE